MRPPIPIRQLEYLLEELCVELGFCLPPDAQAKLLNDPPHDIDEFTAKVIQAEGFKPHEISHDMRQAVRDKVAKKFNTWRAEDR